MKSFPQSLRRALLVVTLTINAVFCNWVAAEEGRPSSVSYFRDVRPILQANCHGCHQPAKSLGDYEMTRFEGLTAAGESGTAAIVPGDPEHSYLLEQITVADGKAEMPKSDKPLAQAEFDLIARWITEGAIDDSPANAVTRYNSEHPPVYDSPPVITSVDFSPDGKWLAVSAYHEVVIYRADDFQIAGRLIGLSERIEANIFSPDSKRIAVAGGSPGRRGELQVWDVERSELLLSKTVGFDTLYGASWSEDGKVVSVGCPDHSLRAFNVETGKQIFFNAAHGDWVFDTAFAVDGNHLVSVSRDRSLKLFELGSQQFIDNITSITPGALKGGLQAVQRHPDRDELLTGGADGVPRLYKMFRQKDRKIGDDFNLVRDYDAVPGRIVDMRFNHEGDRFVVCSSDKDTGWVRVYDTHGEAKDETGLVDVEVPEGGQYTCDFSAGGKQIASGGFDGLVRIFDTDTGKQLRAFPPVPLQSGQSTSLSDDASKTLSAPMRIDMSSSEKLHYDQLPQGFEVQKLVVNVETIKLQNRYAYRQLLLTGELDDGQTCDLTRLAELVSRPTHVSVSTSGQVRPVSNGSDTLVFEFGPHKVSIETQVVGIEKPHRPNFANEVQPIISRLGCNAGTCHGSQDGKNGFKLSLRGYDAAADYLALTDDVAARRFNRVAPDQSLMLLKASGAIPHVGGQLTSPGEPYYELLRKWIADGVSIDQADNLQVSSISVLPANPVLPRANMRQQIAVLAKYSDGSIRDVTDESFIESGDIEIATAESGGVVKTLRRGEAPVLVRYQGNYATTTITVMGDRNGFQWQSQPVHNYIDKLVDAKLKRMKILPGRLCSDAVFVRRIYFDLTGLPPSADQAVSFINDSQPSKQKRDALIDQLIGSREFVEFRTNKWADLLQVNRKFLGEEGSIALRNWIKQAIADNLPYDQFAREVLTASGSTLENPPAAYYKVLREPADLMENSTQLFLGVRFNCNKCHDHPFERWTQDQYYHMAAWFGQVGRKEDSQFAGLKLDGTAVDEGAPLVEVVFDRKSGEVAHERTGLNVAPEFPYSHADLAQADLPRRARMAHWMTSTDNQYFARSYVNRLWGYLLGRGIIDPIDDIRAGNPPTNPELLDALEQDFIESGFDVQHMMQSICKSRTYQTTVAANRWNDDDQVNYSHFIPRRLPAETLFDAIHFAAGSKPDIPGAPRGFRATQLPDAGIRVPFLDDFGKPVRESACECERSTTMVLGPIMKLVNGPTVANALNDKRNALRKLTKEIDDDRELIEQIFLRFLSRYPTDTEIEVGLEAIGAIEDRLSGVQDLAWALINTPSFLFNR